MIEAVRQWLHFLKGRHFTIVTDQEAVSFMFSQTHRGKIKNAKILSWRLELSQLNYDIRHEPGAYKVAPDACLARVLLSPICLSANCTNLSAILDTLDFTTLFGNAICPTPERRQTVFRLCRTCAEIKPCFLSRLFKLRSRL